jgi:carboxyl-terminal processing protease
MVSRRTAVVLAGAAVWLVVALVEFTHSQSPTKKEGPSAKAARLAGVKDEDFELFRALADTLDQIERNYVQPISRRELMEAAIAGMLGKLDPHSSYIPPDDIANFRTSVESQFAGIGIQLGVDDGRLRIVSPLYGTPAYRAGLRAGDLIVSIDGRAADQMKLDDAVRALKGEPGSDVTVTVTRGSSREQIVRKLTREMVHVETVLGEHRGADDRWDFMLDPERRIGYIRVSSFSRDTARDLRQALDRLTGEKLRGLVLDLRFNPGGLLSSAIEVADMFIDEGRIVSTQGRNVAEHVWDAEGPGTYEGFPMVVLVNRFSASASEIVAACLQDHKRAVVVGERTWGKGSVQNVIELEEGKSALKLTTSSYQRPSGKNIHRFPDAKESDDWGVRPNEGYDLRLTDRDMASLFDDRQRRDVLASADSSITEPARAARATVDKQLSKAVDYLVEQLPKQP